MRSMANPNKKRSERQPEVISSKRIKEIAWFPRVPLSPLLVWASVARTCVIACVLFELDTSKGKLGLRNRTPVRDNIVKRAHCLPDATKCGEEARLLLRRQRRT